MLFFFLNALTSISFAGQVKVSMPRSTRLMPGKCFNDQFPKLQLTDYACTKCVCFTVISLKITISIINFQISPTPWLSISGWDK